MNVHPSHRSRARFAPAGLIQYLALLGWAAAAACPTRVLAQEPESTAARGESIKIAVKDDRLYKITGEDLARQGLDLAEIDPARLSLDSGGESRPILIEGLSAEGKFTPKSRLLFWGEAPRGEDGGKNLLTRLNAYFLRWDGSKEPLRFKSTESLPEPEPGAPATTTHPRVLHLEEDWQIKFFQRYLDMKTDRLMWSVYKAPPSKHSTKLAAVPDLSDACTTVTLRALFWGASSLRQNNDHQWSLAFNDHTMGRAVWDGYHALTFEGAIPASAVQKKGQNHLRAVNLQAAGAIDVVSLDWIELNYLADLKPNRNSLAYTLPAGENEGRVRLGAGFTSAPIRVFDLDGATELSVKTRRSEDNQSYTARYVYHWEGEPRRFIALTEDAISAPESLTRRADAGLRPVAAVPEYLIVTDGKFRPAVERLLEHRRGQGLHAEAVTMEDIYDAYSHGVFSPRSLRDYIDDLIEASASAERPLKYVFLVGDANYDTKNIKQGSPNHVPTWHSDEGAYTADYAPVYARDDYFAYGRQNSDKPLVAVGRFPCNDPKQIDGFIDKLIDFESGEADDAAWRRRAILVAAEDFDSYPAALGKELRGWESREIYAKHGDVEGNAKMRDQLVEAFSAGAGLLYFVGHGAEFMWRTGSFDPKRQTDMFTDAEIGRLTNKGMYPVVFASTCFSALFDTPGHSKSGVGVYMVEAAEKGAIACVAHVGKTDVPSGHVFALEMAQRLFAGENPDARLGDAFVNAKRKFAGEVVNSISLIGDPATWFGNRYAPRGGDDHGEGQAPTGEGAPVMIDGDSSPTRTEVPADGLRIRLSWKTETETNSFGYFIYRAESADGPFVCLNEQNPVSGAGTTTTPHRYYYYDLTVKEAVKYYYKVEQVDLDGAREWLIGAEKPLEATPKPLKPEEAEAVEKNGSAWGEETF